MNRIMAPFAAPTKAPVLQGKRRRVRGSVSFGGSNGLLCLSSRREKYCHKGGMALAHHGVGLPSGSTMAIMAPSGGPQKTSGLQGKSRGVRVRGSVPFGGSLDARRRRAQAARERRQGQSGASLGACDQRLTPGGRRTACSTATTSRRVTARGAERPQPSPSPQRLRSAPTASIDPRRHLVRRARSLLI
jgi:hypothetical protein